MFTDEEINEIANKYKNALTGNNKKNSLNAEELAELSEALGEGFDLAIEQLFAGMSGDNINQELLQEKIFEILKQFLSDPKNNPKNIKFDEQTLAEDVKEMSLDLLEQKGAKQKGKKNDKAKQDFLKAVKNFAVYQVYKVMNPRRIAGETKKDNFVHNALTRGVETAKKYTGGSEKDIKSYDKELVKKVVKNQKVGFSR